MCHVSLFESAEAVAPLYRVLAAALHGGQQIEGGMEIRATRVRQALTDSAGVELAKTRDFTFEALGPCAGLRLSAYKWQEGLPAASDTDMRERRLITHS